jgi:hypothetical protein
VLAASKLSAQAELPSIGGDGRSQRQPPFGPFAAESNDRLAPQNK